ncbi:hypothetical protein PUN4_20083 [Paraburkholderia unamae]|nr:hypothetical protein PUN4_20083 [Paraburkholderia unamae]
MLDCPRSVVKHGLPCGAPCRHSKLPDLLANPLPNHYVFHSIAILVRMFVIDLKAKGCTGKSY